MWVKAGSSNWRALSSAAAALLASSGLPFAISSTESAAGRSADARGLIAFAGVHWTDDLNPAGSQIYTVREDGAGLRRLTRAGPWEDTAPAWSRDGTKLAFGRRDGKGWQLHVMDANGSGLHAVTKPQPLADRPSWSPDGRQVVFVGLPSGLPSTGCYAQQLYVISLRSSGIRQLTRFAAFPGGASAPAWSPDGERILFSGKKSADEKAHSDLWVIGANGLGLRRLIANATDPAWSPHAKTIAFVRGGDVYTASANGTNVRRVAHTRDSESLPSWSPDGARIAVARDRSPKDWKKETLRVYVVAAHGTSARAITPADPRFWADAPSWRPAAEP